MAAYPDPFYMMKGYRDMAKLYPYLTELKKQEPPIYANLQETDPNFSGYVQGTRYENRDVPRLVVIDRSEKGTITEPHEYIHYGIDVSPNWSNIIPPTMEGLNQPTPRMKGVMSFLRGYPEQLAFEEGVARTMTPDEEISKYLFANPEGFFTEQQRQILPYLQRYLQYGPTWGSFAGEEESGFIIDPTYRGTQVPAPRGKFSSERTMTFQHGDTHYVIPTLFRGKQLKPEEAFGMFRRGYLPAVAAASTKEEANRLAVERSEMLGREGKGNVEFAPPPRKAKAGEVKGLKKPQYSKVSTGKQEPEPEPYGWSDMNFYP